MDKKLYQFVFDQLKDPILEWRTCRFTGEEFLVLPII